ncbi:MAG: 1,4-alpha-glucan branching protein GlgB [Planctomycetia bacterium]
MQTHTVVPIQQSHGKVAGTFDQPVDAGSLYRYWGAHIVPGGVRFAVWAPDAREVSVISDSNGWTAGRDWLSSSDNGVWHGTVRGVIPGTRYKYAIRTQSGHLLEKADPVGFYFERRPQTASVVWSLRDFNWQDSEWMARRAKTDWLHSPLSIYEVHLGSWKRPDDGRIFFSYRELAHELADYVSEMGYTHVQLLPVTEHPFDGSWGYQTTGYFAPTSRFGSPHDFQYFVDHLHQRGIGVLIDWVPGHFPSDLHALAQFDGTCLYEHADPRLGYHPDWKTLIFNYGRREVSEFLISSARFWCDVYHVDGLRVDAVASMLYLDYSRDSGQWIPNQYGGRENLDAIDFLRRMNTMLHADFPGILTIAEESTAWPGVSSPCYTGGLGFTMKWDMGWMNDTLRFMRRDSVHRRYHLNDLTFRSIYAFSENFVLPLSHDEVVHGKKSLLSQMSGDKWQQFANLRLMLASQYASPGKKLHFMGTELGQWTEWNHDAELDWVLRSFDSHEGIRRMLCDLNRLYLAESALHDSDHDGSGFSWIVGDDQKNCVMAWIRQSTSNNQLIVVICNLTPSPHVHYRIGVPVAGFYSEIFNSDGTWYGGTGVGNQGGVYSSATPSHGRINSIAITVPPLGMTMFRAIVAAEAAEPSAR